MNLPTVFNNNFIVVTRALNLTNFASSVYSGHYYGIVVKFISSNDESLIHHQCHKNMNMLLVIISGHYLLLVARLVI